MTEITRLHRREVSKLDIEVREAFEQHRVRQLEPEPRGPDEHDLGRLSAEAVLAQFETMAKNVETMGEAMKERVHKLEASLRECDIDLKEIEETAKKVREKGHLIQAQIEEVAVLSRDIRDTCIEITKKVS